MSRFGRADVSENRKLASRRASYVIFLCHAVRRPVLKPEKKRSTSLTSLSNVLEPTGWTGRRCVISARTSYQMRETRTTPPFERALNAWFVPLKEFFVEKRNGSYVMYSEVTIGMHVLCIKAILAFSLNLLFCFVD